MARIQVPVHVASVTGTRPASVSTRAAIESRPAPQGAFVSISRGHLIDADDGPEYSLLSCLERASELSILTMYGRFAMDNSRQQSRTTSFFKDHIVGMFIFAVVTGLISSFLFLALSDSDRAETPGRDAPVELSSVKTGPIELGEIIQSFMMPVGQAQPDWKLAWLSPDLPIDWSTNGVEYDADVYRAASARVAISGRVITVMRNGPEEVPWNLVVRGNKFGPDVMEIEPDSECFDLTASGCDYDIEEALAVAQIEFDLLCYEGPAMSNLSLYRLSSKGKENAFLVQMYTEGSIGASADSRLYWANPAGSEDRQAACLWLKSEL